MSTQPEIQRRHNRKLHRSWSLEDVQELRDRKIEGKLDLAAFLREASALVHNLRQATLLLEKGRQLNTTTYAPRAEQNDTFNTVHNDLWVAAESASFLSQSPCPETERSYISSTSLPSVVLSKGNDNGRARISKNIPQCHRNILSISKNCNIDTQMELDHINHNGRSNWSYDRRCYEYDMHHASSLPDCSSTDHWHCCCSTSACPIHQSASHLSVFNDNQQYGRPFSLSSPPCSPRAYRQHLVAIRRQIIRASSPVMFTNFK
jgi:hypothetical protein